MNSKQMLFALLRMQICGAAVGEEVQKALSPQILEELYSLSLKHDLAHIAGQALGDLGCLGDDEISGKFKKQAMLAVYRHTRMEHDFQSICNTLEAAKIPYIPLKGAVIRKYYPEAWMRTSCDIDVLVKTELLDDAVKLLQDRMGFSYQAKTSHDVSLYSPNNVHLELHFDLTDDAVSVAQRTVLRRVWEYSAPAEEMRSMWKMLDETFYFYHIAHMAKHIENGGCGIKPFLDLWILNHQVVHDRQKREELLAEGGLLTFARAAEKLSEVWFSGAEVDSLSLQLEQYVLDGGVYGTLKNSIVVKQAQKGGKLQYMLFKIWQPYNIIKYAYPVLQKHKWLTPIYQVRRWLRIIFCDGLGRSINILQTNAGMEDTERNAVKCLLDELGL